MLGTCLIFTDLCSILLQNSQCLSSKCCLSLLRQERDYVNDHVWGINAGRNTKICFLCLMTGFLNHLTTFFVQCFSCVSKAHFSCIETDCTNYPMISFPDTQCSQHNQYKEIFYLKCSHSFFFSKGHINNKWISNCFNSDHSKVT